MMNASDFMIGGLAACGSTLFTNPFEVIKTRIQLQGELSKHGTYVKPYKSVLSAFITVAKNDGLLGLQKGLVPALYFQFVINSFRLSIYNKAMEKRWVHTKDGEISFSLGIFWGAFGGAVGSFFSSPFFMIKTQLQAQTTKNVAVGYQHDHSSMSDAFKQIYRKHGVFGLWRGAAASLPRSCIGSGAQLATFGSTKQLLLDYDLVQQNTLNSFCAGIIAGTVAAFAITPPDVVATRLYNQGVDQHGRGLTYNSYVDCAVKILRTEGVYGLYKGFWPNYLRIGPHSTLLLLFFDELVALKNKHLAGL